MTQDGIGGRGKAVSVPAGSVPDSGRPNKDRRAVFALHEQFMMEPSGYSSVSCIGNQTLPSQVVLQPCLGCVNPFGLPSSAGLPSVGQFH